MSCRRAAFAVAFVTTFLCGVTALAGAQAPTSATATLTSPPDGQVYYIIYYSNPECQDTFPLVIAAGDMSVAAAGTPNAQFTVDWNMWVKIDGDSVCDNDTSHGWVQRNFNAFGKWDKTAHLGGSRTFTTTGSHLAEAAAIIVVGTQTLAAFDRHNFSIAGQSQEDCGPG